MKISVAWLSDYLDTKLTNKDVPYLHKIFNQKTAEMEHVQEVSFDFKNCAAGIVTVIEPQGIVVEIPEWKQTQRLSLRSDAKVGQVFLLKKESTIGWAAPHHFYSDKDGLLPAFNISLQDRAGGWKNQIEESDTILEIDNKSLTHRPDLWGHYGFAREVAAILDLPFKPLQSCFDQLVLQTKSDFNVTIEDTKGCKRFIGMFCDTFTPVDSSIKLGLRLLKGGMRPINGIIDITNYVMLEMAQPTHVYDASRIAKKHLMVRFAKTDETIKLLDEAALTLTTQDLVIADPQKILGLAGVRGGLEDSINQNTTSLFFEAAHFDAAIVRKAAVRHKTRTDASTRFEKTLDPNALELTTSRFVELAKAGGISFNCYAPIVVGPQEVERSLIVSHEFLKNRSGISLTEEQVVKPLNKLGFTVTAKEQKYEIKIPSYRGTKDIEQPEDILEEVTRMYGFDLITPIIPAMSKKPNDISQLMRLRAIKNYLSTGAQMLEVQNYAFFDETFMAKIGWSTTGLVSIKNPVSEQYKHLITTLIPNLLKKVEEDFVEYNSLAFFEAACTWNKSEEEGMGEHKKIAGIFFEKRKPINFYEAKQKVTELLQVCSIKNSMIAKVTPSIMAQYQWMEPYQVAEFFVDGCSIGYAGKVSKKLLQLLGCLPESDAFVFEFDGNFLYNYKTTNTTLKPIPVYQGSSFDISMMVSLATEAQTIRTILQTADERIEKVELVDFFEKESWKTERSLAFRIWVRDTQKTMVKEEIDMIYQKAIALVRAQGVTIRD